MIDSEYRQDHHNVLCIELNYIIIKSFLIYCNKKAMARSFASYRDIILAELGNINICTYISNASMI
jgi:hypothetical protein